MFIVELAPQDNNKDVYKLKSILNCRVVVEPPRPVHDIPQCGNCQRYGHTKKYCHRKPKCIKCAGDHPSAKCQNKFLGNKVKCTLCEGQHPANYKGCKVYKDLQKRTTPKLRPKKKQDEVDVKILTTKTNLTQTNKGQPRLTGNFFEGTTKTSWKPTKPNNDDNNHTDSGGNSNNDMKQLTEMFKQILNQLSTMTNLLTNLMTIMCKNSTK
jgi:hypothetical protein